MLALFTKENIFRIAPFLLGVIVGFLIAKWDLLNFDYEVNLIDLLDLIFTVVIAITVPLFLTRILDNRKVIKTVLVDELKNLFDNYLRIKKVLDDAQYKQEITLSEKYLIQQHLEEADLQLIALEEQITIAFPSIASSLFSDLHSARGNYYRFLTGGDLMSDLFTEVSHKFCANHNIEFQKINISIKTLIQKIYNL